jgi:hypothetical protein
MIVCSLRRFNRLSKSRVFETMFDTLASMRASAHLVQMFDSTIVRAHVSATGEKGGSQSSLPRPYTSPGAGSNWAKFKRRIVSVKNPIN